MTGEGRDTESKPFRNSTPTVRLFPDEWGQVEIFVHLYSNTYSFSKIETRALSGVRSHARKFMHLINLSYKLAPGLQLDNDHLDQHGFTPAINAAELGTVIEASILELYSCLDCVRKVIVAVYNVRPSKKSGSTTRFFEQTEELSGLPQHLKQLVLATKWFHGFRLLRDELTHYETGSVRLDRNTKLITYDHYGMTQNGQPFHVDDILDWIAKRYALINEFIGQVFYELNGTLKDEETFEVCGMVEGRLLGRYIRPSQTITFNSGRCQSWIWFELPENPTCPFKDHCGAYHNKAPAPVSET